MSDGTSKVRADPDAEAGGHMAEDDRPLRGSGYGVKLVRGPFVRLPAHHNAHDDEATFLNWAQELLAGGGRLAADLFAGAGGLSLGLEMSGWHVVIAVDHDVEAVETHRHHFAGLALDLDLSDSNNV